MLLQIGEIMDDLNYLGIAKLLLDVQAPTLEECWEEGFEFADTRTLSDNPYTVGTANYYHWQDGWWSRKFGMEELDLSLEIAANDSYSLSVDNAHDQQIVASEV